MKYAQIFAIGTILAMLSPLVGGGCSTVGDGRLEPVTKATAKAALTAASVAAPEYAAVLKRIQAQV